MSKCVLALRLPEHKLSIHLVVRVFFLAMTLEAYHLPQLRYLNGLASTLSTLSAAISHLVRVYTCNALEGKRNAKMDPSWKRDTGHFHQMALSQRISKTFDQ